MIGCVKVCVWLRRNELDATAHFGMPANRVVEMGLRLEVRSPGAVPPSQSRDCYYFDSWLRILHKG